MIKILVVSAVLIISGCANIPQESVTLSQEIGAGIKSIHESNVRLVNQYFASKKIEIESYQEKALERFFNEIAAATAVPGAPPLGARELFKMKQEIDRINAEASKYIAALETSRNMTLEKLQANYSILIAANGSVTGILQSAVDLDKAKNDGLSKVKELSGGRVDLTNIEAEIDNFLAKIGSHSASATDLTNSIQSILDKD